MDTINASPIRHISKANKPDSLENGDLMHIIAKITNVHKDNGGPTLAEQYELSGSITVRFKLLIVLVVFSDIKKKIPLNQYTYNFIN
jgi:hypothetical protein